MQQERDKEKEKDHTGAQTLVFTTMQDRGHISPLNYHYFDSL